MFFAITALGVSAVQIVIGIAIGMSLRKSRRRQRMDSDAPSGLEARDKDRKAPRAVQPVQPSRPADEPLSAGKEQDAANTVAATNSKEVKSTGEATAQPAIKSDQRPKNEHPLEAPQTIPEPDPLPPEGNRRRSARRNFEFRQQVAPYNGGLLPRKASFREVECHDISSTGFSFLSSQLPDFDSVVVALGVAPRQVYLWAEIVNRFRLEDGPAPLYRIGCRFVGQVSQ